MQPSNAHPGLMVHIQGKGGSLFRATRGLDQDLLTAERNCRCNRPDTRNGWQLQPDPFGGTVESKAGDRPFAKRRAIQLLLAVFQGDIFRTEQYLDPTIAAEARGIPGKPKDVGTYLDL